MEQKSFSQKLVNKSYTFTQMLTTRLQAQEVIKHYGLNRKQHLQDLLIYRQKFEKAITKRYGVKFTYQLNEDVQTKYNVKRVPQHIQVQSGILDLLIGRLNTIHVDVSKLISDAA